MVISIIILYKKVKIFPLKNLAKHYRVLNREVWLYNSRGGENVPTFIADMERDVYNEKHRNSILSNYNEVSGTVFRKYNA